MTKPSTIYQITILILSVLVAGIPTAVRGSGHSGNTENLLFKTNALTLLPEEAEASEGELSLYVDWDSEIPNGQLITTYVINRTTSPVEKLINIRQEAYLDSKWVRCDPDQRAVCIVSEFGYFPTIPPNRFQAAPKVLPQISSNDSEDTFKTTVRYRILGTDIVSNTSEQSVSKRFIEESSYDPSSIKEASVERVVHLALAPNPTLIKAGERISWKQDSKLYALSELRSFAGDPLAEATARKLLETDQGLHTVCLLLTLPRREIFDYLAAATRDSSHPFHEEAFNELPEYAFDFKDEFAELCDFILENTNDPRFIAALRERSKLWDKKELHENIGKHLSNKTHPNKLRREVRTLAAEVIPNRNLRLTWQFDAQYENVTVWLQNTSESTINLHYSHPYDLIETEMIVEDRTLAFAPPEAPSSGTHSLETALASGESIKLPSFSPWEFHTFPTTIPEQVVLQIRTNLPELGIVPSGAAAFRTIPLPDRLRNSLK